MAGSLGVLAIPFVGCVALLMAEILQILSFASPYWASDSQRSFGLWRYARCAGGPNVDCYRYDFQWNVPVWQNAVRGLESLAIIFVAIPLVIIPVYLYVAMGMKYKSVFVTMTIMALLATLCNIAGVVVYGLAIGTNNEWTMGWCLITCIIGAGGDFVGFLILLIATMNKPYFTPPSFYSSGFFVNPTSHKLYAIEGVEHDFMKSDDYAYGGQSLSGHVNPAGETD